MNLKGEIKKSVIESSEGQHSNPYNPLTREVEASFKLALKNHSESHFMS